MGGFVRARRSSWRKRGTWGVWGGTSGEWTQASLHSPGNSHELVQRSRMSQTIAHWTNHRRPPAEKAKNSSTPLITFHLKGATLLIENLSVKHRIFSTVVINFGIFLMFYPSIEHMWKFSNLGRFWGRSSEKGPKSGVIPETLSQQVPSCIRALDK